MEVIFEDLGKIEYKNAWDYQEEIFNSLVDFKFKPENYEKKPLSKLLFCEHPHVYTLGKNGAANNLLINEEYLKKIDATYYKTNRGGDITYHGPQQIVGYPIFDLDELKIGIREYIFKLEESIIQLLKCFDITSGRLEGATGVWLDTDTSPRKICAIGVRASRNVTMHGFALNINTDLKYYNYINPCGFVDKGVTSLQKELNREIPFEDAKSIVKDCIAMVFGVSFT